MLEDNFRQLELILLGDNRRLLDEIKERFYHNIECWEADRELDYEENNELAEEQENLLKIISENNDKISALCGKNSALDGRIEEFEKKLIFLNKSNKKKLVDLRKNVKAIENEKEKLKRSYAGRLGNSRKQHSRTIKIIEEMFSISNSNKFKVIENLKSRIRALSEEVIDICPTCSSVRDKCRCR